MFTEKIINKIFEIIINLMEIPIFLAGFTILMLGSMWIIGWGIVVIPYSIYTIVIPFFKIPLPPTTNISTYLWECVKLIGVLIYIAITLCVYYNIFLKRKK